MDGLLLVWFIEQAKPQIIYWAQKMLSWQITEYFLIQMIIYPRLQHDIDPLHILTFMATENWWGCLHFLEDNEIYCLPGLNTIQQSMTITDNKLIPKGQHQYTLHQCQNDRKGWMRTKDFRAEHRRGKRIWSHRQLPSCSPCLDFPQLRAERKAPSVICQTTTGSGLRASCTYLQLHQ